MQCDAAVVREINQLSIEKVQLDLPQPREVLVRMRAAGICHSDLHTMRGELRAKPPLVLGHEGAGVVEVVGKEVRRVQPGDHVVINWLPACGECTMCLSGIANQCERLPRTTFLGLLPDGTTRLSTSDGLVLKHYLSSATLSEYAILHEASVIPIPKDIPFEVAAISGCAVLTGVGAALKTAQVQSGRSVVVLGLGGVGLSMLLACRLAGCQPIIAVDQWEHKLALARQLGADELINSCYQDLVTEVRALTAGRGADFVLDSVGAEATIARGLQALAPRGRMAVAGLFDATKQVAIPAGALIFQEKHLMGSFAGSSNPNLDLPWLLSLFQSGQLPVERLITHRYSLKEVPQAMEHLQKGLMGRGVVLFDEHS